MFPANGCCSLILIELNNKYAVTSFRHTLKLPDGRFLSCSVGKSCIGYMKESTRNPRSGKKSTYKTTRQLYTYSTTCILL